MEIYFSASISGGRDYLNTYKCIVEHLKGTDHVVLTDHIVLDDIGLHESRLTDRAIFERDIQWLENCDAMIAEVSNPSLGVGYEICYAVEKAIPILCVYAHGLSISKMITGNSSSSIQLYEYSRMENLLSRIDKFLTETKK